MCMSEETAGRYRNVIAVSNRHLCRRPLDEQVERVCRCRPRALILREKDLSEVEYAALARRAMEICGRYQVPCILHTYLDTARVLGCPAIHLPLPLLREAGDRLAGFSTIGTSVHSVEEAAEAQTLGASYLSAGHIYPTGCKPGAPPRGLDFLRQVCQAVSIPVYAIGGIRPDGAQLAEVMACGAAGGCIMSGMMQL